MKRSIFLLTLLFISSSAQAMEATPIKFAVIGDFGSKGEKNAQVSQLVKSWNPDFILTTGDNNYPRGERKTIDGNIGAYYSEYIYPYTGRYTQPTIAENRFYPCLGNHDFDKEEGANPYFDYFPALNRQYYYDFVKGSVHFFSVCSDKKCEDGISPDSPQLRWLEERVRASQSPWKIVYYHHPTCSSACQSPGWGSWPATDIEENGERRIDPPFAQWGGVSAVLCGHLHLYERLNIDGIHTVINGLGGDDSFYPFHGEPSRHSVKRFEKENGAMLFEADERKLSFKFTTVSGQLIDEFILEK